MRIGSLFSGIGGLELGLEWSGLGHTVWQVEQDEHCRAVLEKNWPHVRRYTRVEEVGKKNLEAVDLICGGFPCQDIAAPGKRIGLSGPRSGLWTEFARIARECRPEWLIVENVASGAKNWVDLVQRDLERIGYASFPPPLAARDVGAPHRRSRVFVIARRTGGVSDRDSVKVREHEQRKPARRSRRVQDERDAQSRHGRQAVAHGRRDRSGVVGSRNDARQQEEQDEARDKPHRRHARMAGEFPPLRTDFDGWDRYLREGGPQPGVLPGADGLPRGLARRRIAALGNAVVPQDSEVVGYVVQELIRMIEKKNTIALLAADRERRLRGGA